MDQLQQTLLLQQDYLRHSSSFAEQPEKRNDLNTIVPFIRIDSAISTTTTTSTNANPITIALEKPSCYTYLPGEIIQGKFFNNANSLNSIYLLYFQKYRNRDS
jgi:hypothetical protein